MSQTGISNCNNVINGTIVFNLCRNLKDYAIINILISCDFDGVFLVRTR